MAAAATPELPAQTPTGADSLAGIWVSETTYGPALRGELTVAREGARWRAALAGVRASFQAAGDSVRFAMPDGAGAFRGRVADGGRTIRGFWVRPSGETEDRQNPGGSGQPFTTPVVLRADGGDTWRGTVEPLEDRFTLHLRIFPADDGALRAAFRNPELNSRGGASQYRVTGRGDSVWFTARPDSAEPEVRHAAALLRSPDRLRLFWRTAGRTLELVRAPAEAAGFFPRPRGEPPYAYRPPPETGDGWTTARAADVGIDEGALTRVVQRLAATDPTDPRAPLMHSFLVAHRGRLVLEEYFHGYDRETTHDMRSAGKTFGSVMLGAAMREGAPLSPETRIYELLAGWSPFANPDPRKGRITLAHLMTHNAGLACDDNDDASPGNEGTMQRQEAQPDWWRYTLDLAVAHDPGTRYAYCSANINLVGAALTAGTRTWLPELFRRTVAEPLEFGRWHWNVMPTGEGYLGGGAFLRPRDLLKIGQAYLDGGVWKGRRIVDPAWIALSTASHAVISPATTGLAPEVFGEFYGEGVDGLAWHLSTLRAGERTYNGYAASGNGGQLLVVVPELEMAVVFTGGNYLQGGIWGRWPQEIIGGEIIPAIPPGPRR